MATPIIGPLPADLPVYGEDEDLLQAPTQVIPVPEDPSLAFEPAEPVVVPLEDDPLAGLDAISGGSFAPLEARPAVPQAAQAPLPTGAVPPAPGQTVEQAAADVTRAQTLDQTFGGARQSVGTVQRFDSAIDSKQRELLDVTSQYAVETDPAKRQELATRGQQLESDLQGLGVVRGVAQEQSDVELARARADQQARLQEEGLRMQRNAADEMAAYNDSQQARIQQAQADRDAGRAEAASKRQQYQELLGRQRKEEGRTSTLGALSLVGELFQSYAENRAPNFDAPIKRILDSAAERWQRERQSAQADVQVTEAGIDDANAQLKQIEADRAAFNAALLGDVQAQLTVLAQEAQGTPREVAIFEAQRAVEQRLAAADADAAMKAEKAAQERRLAEAELAYKQAQTAKLEAETGKLGRAGMGKKDETAPRFGGDPRILKERYGLDDDELKRAVWPAGTGAAPALASTPEEAKELRKAMSASNTTNRMIAQLIHLRENHGGDWSLVFKSPEFTEMKSLHTQLKVGANKSYGLGSLDDGTQAALDNIFGGDPNSLRTDPLPALRSAQAQLRNSVQDQIEQLAPGYEGGVNLAGYTPTKTNDEKMPDVAAMATRGRDPDGVLNPLRDRVNSVRQVAEANAANPSVANKQLDEVKGEVAKRQQQIEEELDKLGGGASAVGKVLGIGGKEDPGKKAVREQLREEYQANQTVLAEVEKQRPKVEKRTQEKERQDKAPKQLVW